MSVPEDYPTRAKLFEKYAHDMHKDSKRFHAAGIRKAIEADYGVMRQSHYITLEKDISRWMRNHARIALLGIEGRTHYYAFKGRGE
jgi:hypothetical protein